VTAWLKSANFAETGEEVFLSKWDPLPNTARRVISAVIAEGGQAVKESTVRQHLNRKFGVDVNTADTQVREAKLHFLQTDLVKLISNIHSGDELSINPTWQFSLRRHCAAWLRGQGHT